MIKLTNSTRFPLLSIVRAARNCHHSFDKLDTKTRFCEDSEQESLGPNDEKLIRKCIDLGHESILEHCSFTFEFSMSRCAQTQLVRHRLASFAIESMRYVEPSGFVLPDTIKKSENLRTEFLSKLAQLNEFYQEMVKAGIPLEDARYILPLATTGTIIYTANLRSLRHAIAERTCLTSQWEIRKIFNLIKNKLRKIHPVLVYKCEKLHYNCKSKCGKCEEIINYETE